MPCPDGFTERQCKLRDHIAKRIEKKGEEGVNAWAVATAIVKRKKEKHQS